MQFLLQPELPCTRCTMGRNFPMSLLGESVCDNVCFSSSTQLTQITKQTPSNNQAEIQVSQQQRNQSEWKVEQEMMHTFHDVDRGWHLAAGQSELASMSVSWWRFALNWAPQRDECWACRLPVYGECSTQTGHAGVEVVKLSESNFHLSYNGNIVMST